jgi:hypothetical protein
MQPFWVGMRPKALAESKQGCISFSLFLQLPVHWKASLFAHPGRKGLLKAIYTTEKD